MPILRNVRHERFVQELVKGRSVTDAYGAAGYVRDASHGYKLRRKPQVAARIDELLGRAAAKAEVTAERVLRELALIGFANMKDISTRSSSGPASVPSSQPAASASRPRTRPAMRTAAPEPAVSLFHVNRKSRNGNPRQRRERNPYNRQPRGRPCAQRCARGARLDATQLEDGAGNRDDPDVRRDLHGPARRDPAPRQGHRFPG